MENLKVKSEVAIIGGGPAGYSCALFCAKSGKKVVLIEKDEIGGVCLNRGCIPTKAVIASLKKGDKEPEKINEKKNKVVALLKKSVLSYLKNAGVEIIKGEGRFIEEKKIAVGNIEVQSENIVIATGSAPAKPPFSSPLILSADRAIDEWLPHPPDRILIVGGGAIGCEFATIFSRMGKEVIIVEMMDHILPSLDKDIAEVLQREFKKRRVKIICGEKIKEINEGTAILESGKTIEFKGILWATGRIANTTSLALEKAGVETSNGWIKVDETLRTSNPDIYAVGDCNGISLTAYAGYIQSLTVARNITGAREYYDSSCIPYAVFSEPEVAWVGYTERTAKALNVSIKTSKVLMRSIGRAQAEGEIGGVCKLIVDSNNIVKGAQLVGAHASELIHYLALLIKHGTTAEELSKLHHIHPSFSEIIWESALTISGLPLHG